MVACFLSSATTLRTALILIIIFLCLAVFLPFVLGFTGLRELQFGFIGGPAFSAGSTLLRSTDQGTIWDHISISGDERIPFPSAIFDLAFHPVDHDTLYLGTKSSGLWKSITGGATWHKVRDSRNVLSSGADVYKIAVGRLDPEVLYLAVSQDSRRLILSSEDGAKSFREIYSVPSNRVTILDLAACAFHRGHLLVLTSQKELLESRDGGESWQRKYQFPDMSPHLLLDPDSPTVMYVMTSQGKIMRSLDGGSTWRNPETEVKEVKDQDTVFTPTQPPSDLFSDIFFRTSYTLVMDTDSHHTLYRTSRGGLSRSKNGGISWEQLVLPGVSRGTKIGGLAISPRRSATIFAVAVNRIHRSDDGGTNWNIKTFPFEGQTNLLFIHPLRPEVMFAILGR